MSDVRAIIDRLYRTYLYPPDHRPAQAHLAGDITEAAVSFQLANFVIPEDEELVRSGVFLEAGSELIQVTAYDEATTTITSCIRGVLGTTQAAHSADDPVLLSPPYPRLSVFEAVADNIITLYPRLYRVTTQEVVTVTGNVAALDDPLAVEVVEAWQDGTHSTTDVDARIVDYHPAVGGRAIITNIGTGEIWVKFRKRFGDAASEDDTLVDLGVEPRWVNIVILGACADLFSGRDLPASQVEFVEATLQAENIPVGTRSSLAQRLASYREYLMENAKREMRSEYRAKTHMRPHVQVRTRSPFG